MNTFYEHPKSSIKFAYRCFDRILLNGMTQPFQHPSERDHLCLRTEPATNDITDCSIRKGDCALKVRDDGRPIVVGATPRYEICRFNSGQSGKSRQTLS